VYDSVLYYIVLHDRVLYYSVLYYRVLIIVYGSLT